MTPNLASARQAIQAELSHARQGMAFYTARVEALETALSQIESVESKGNSVPEKRRRKASAANGRQNGESGRGRTRRPVKAESGASAAGQRGRGKKPRGSNSSDEEGRLPTTGTDFWLKLVTEEPKSAVEIANAAAEAIGLQPGQKEQIQKLKQRVAPALATLVSAQKIQDSGAGRQRRFFRGDQQSA